MVYKELNVDDLTEIDSISSFISAVKELKESTDGTSNEIYFRGQDAEFWDIKPSVFRNDMLSVEHRLMQIPLQKIPSEFKEFQTMFDIMTKYQHYGMCTRLLDLTTNPLVALYFACKNHGMECYIDGENKTLHEPYGVIYFTKNYYLSLPTDIEVQIISALAQYDLSKENTVSAVLSKLERDNIIDEKMYHHWLSEDGFKKFVKIIQSNYMVAPTYTNERLKKQSSVFLLTSMFSISNDTSIEESVITKSSGNLRNEFEKTFFFIRGENKKDLLRELDLYNINEASLFPELEHQLSYIKSVNAGAVQSVAAFSKYEPPSAPDESLKIPNSKQLQNSDKLNQYILSHLSETLDGIAKPDEIDEIKKIIQSDLAVDWYNRETIISKLRVIITGYYFVKTQDTKKAKEAAIQITNLLLDAVKKYTEANDGECEEQ